MSVSTRQHSLPCGVQETWLPDLSLQALAGRQQLLGRRLAAFPDQLCLTRWQPEP